MKKIIIINGPNINLTGIREKGVYGTLTLEEINNSIDAYAKEQGVWCEFFQSNSEGALIDKLHSLMGTGIGAVLNAGAYTHYSYAIRDAIASIDVQMCIRDRIVSAGLLAFLILYNLTNMNVSERYREIASLKVLGFYDGEVLTYVYRENFILTGIGIVLGCFLGILLHTFLIATTEVNAVMFGRVIETASYIWSICLTAGFALLVNFVMYFKLKKIDMVEALKTVE